MYDPSDREHFPSIQPEVMLGGIPLGQLRGMEHDPAEAAYDYFSYPANARLVDLNKKIEEREKHLFELQLSELSLMDNPIPAPNVITHDDFAALMAQQKTDTEISGKRWVQVQVCPCPTCEIVRLRDAIAGTTFVLNKFRALAGTLAGTK